MEFRQLEVFLAVAEFKSFSKAAEVLFLTQSTVSSHIKNLENELQKSLITRTTKSLQLTDDGIRFLSYVKRILETRDSALTELKTPSESLLRIGASTIPSGYLLPDIINQFHQLHPKTSFYIQQGDSTEIIEKILNGSVEIGLVGCASTSPKCISIPFCRDELVLVTPCTPYYEEFKHLSNPLPLLLQEPIIIREQGSGTQKVAYQILEQFQISRKNLSIIAQNNDLESIKRMIINGMGVTLCSHLAIQDIEATGKVLVYSVNTSVERHFYITYQKSRILKPALQDFITYIQNSFALNKTDEK